MEARQKKKIDYNSHLLELKEVLRDVFYRYDGSAGFAAEVPTVISQDDRNLSETVLSVVIEFFRHSAESCK